MKVGICDCSTANGSRELWVVRASFLAAALPKALPNLDAAPLFNNNNINQPMEAVAESGETCVICLSAISERAVASCNHAAFDFLCLVSWLQQRSTCPLCKAEVTAVTYGHCSPSEFKTYHVRCTRPPATASLPENRRSLPRRPRARRASSPPTYDRAILRRRHVYRHKLYSLHVGNNGLSQYYNYTPQMIADSSQLQSYARMFIRRELRVFRFLHEAPPGTTAEAEMTPSNAEFLLTYIVSILKAVDIKASDGQAEEMLQEYLGRENARLFLHELNAWMRSPYTKLEDWDRHVQYREPLLPEFEEAEIAAQRGKARRPGHPEISSAGQTRTSRGWRQRETPRRHDPY